MLGTLDLQVYGYGWCVGRVQDSGLSGVWVGLVYRVCWGPWTFRCMGRAGIYGVLGALDFQVYGMAIVHDVFRTLDFQVYGLSNFVRMCWGPWTFRWMGRPVL